MSEKEKNKRKDDSNTLLGISLGYIALAILAIPMLCIAVIGLFVAYHNIRLYQCFDESEPFEWIGLLDFPAPETQSPISQANLSELSLLPYSPDASIFPHLRPIEPALYYTDSAYSPAISHPAHDYFLSSNASYLDIFYNPRLILCQPNGWASHVLSSDVGSYGFSPDGSLFATIASDREKIEIYDANTIELLSTYTIPRPESTIIYVFAFHPTEAWIVISLGEGISSSIELGETRSGLYFWNYETQQELAIIDYEGATFLAFNEEGTLLIARKRQGQHISNAVWGIPSE